MLRSLIIAFALLLGLAQAAPAFEIGDDGLHKESWFSVTFRDINEDILAAKEAGKRLAIIFEQRGCIYCKEVHEVVLADPQVRDYIKENFMVVQYNLHGSEEVIDTDGEELTEKAAARNSGGSATEAASAIRPSTDSKSSTRSTTIVPNARGMPTRSSARHAR